jgi:hypothetical protein
MELPLCLLVVVLAGALQAGAAPSLAAGTARSAAQCWKVVPNPGPSGADVGGVSGTSPTDVWAVGDQVSDPEVPFIMHWDGASWAISPVGRIRNAVVDAVAAVSPTDVWAVGGLVGSVAMHWDGTRWSKFPTPYPGEESHLYDVVAIAPDDIWGVGVTITYQGNLIPLAMHWNGTVWRVVPTPLDGAVFYSVAASSANDVWAVGYQDDPGPALFQPLVEHWDGASWTIIPVPWPPPPATINILYGVASVSPGDAWAVGSYTTLQQQALIYHWDGAVWKPFPIRLPDMNALYSVVAISSNDVWAVGEHDPNFTDYFPLTMHWDGFQWSAVPGANPDLHATFHDVTAIFSHDVWAVGATTREGEGGFPLTERLGGCRTWGRSRTGGDQAGFSLVRNLRTSTAGLRRAVGVSRAVVPAETRPKVGSGDLSVAPREE